MAKAKRKKTSASARKRKSTGSSTRKTRSTKSSKRTTSKRRTTIGAMAKKARAATKTRLGKVAALVLAGATAGAVRAVIPQLENAAHSQEKVTKRTKAGEAKARSKTRKARASA